MNTNYKPKIIEISDVKVQKLFFFVDFTWNDPKAKLLW